MTLNCNLIEPGKKYSAHLAFIARGYGARVGFGMGAISQYVSTVNLWELVRDASELRGGRVRIGAISPYPFLMCRGYGRRSMRYRRNT